MLFVPATEKQLKLRLAIDGPSGAGKTFTALTFAFALGKKVAVLDTERGSAAKYRKQFPTFLHADLKSHNPLEYIKAIEEINNTSCDVLVIDSLSHAWAGKDGALETVDKKAKASQSGNTWAAWRDVTPLHNQLVEAILNCKAHVIATMRVKTEWVTVENERGKKVPQKIGLAPIQRDGVEYEFDIMADMNLDHDLIIGKSRCSAVDKLVVSFPTAKFLDPVLEWLGSGEARSDEPAPKSASGAEESRAAGDQTAHSAEASATNAQTNGSEPARQTQSTPSERTPESASASPKPSESASAAEQPAAPGTAAKTDALAPASATSTPESATSGADPKSVGAAQQKPQQNQSTATGQAASGASSSPSEQKVGAEQMKQLLTAGTANGWQRGQISAFVCHAFKLTPETFSNITWGDWQQAVKLVSHPQNANGQIRVGASGKPLPEKHFWPVAEKAAQGGN